MSQTGVAKNLGGRLVRAARKQRAQENRRAKIDVDVVGTATFSKLTKAALPWFFEPLMKAGPSPQLCGWLSAALPARTTDDGDGGWLERFVSVWGKHNGSALKLQEEYMAQLCLYCFLDLRLGCAIVMDYYGCATSFVGKPPGCVFISSMLFRD